jgi:ABC-2 type transport system permease protein
LWFLNAFFAKTFDDVNLIPTFIITPMIYLGWVFYPVSVLTWFWAILTQLNPIYYMINGLRYAMLGSSEINIWVALWALILCNVALFYANLRLFQNGYWLKH